MSDAITQPLPCCYCGKAPTVERDYFWIVTCDDCYDYDPDLGGGPISSCIKRENAVQGWNDDMLDWAELNPTPDFHSPSEQA